MLRRARVLPAVLGALLALPPAAAAEATAGTATVHVTGGCLVLMRGQTVPIEVTVGGPAETAVPNLRLEPDLPPGFTATVEPQGLPVYGDARIFDVRVTTPPDAPLGAVPLRFTATGDGMAPATVDWEMLVVGPPDPATGVTAVAGDGVATVSWQPATFSRPDPPDEEPRPRLYWVTAHPGGARTTVRTTGTTATVAGLTNGTAYTFTVTAYEDWGVAESAPSAPVTPTAAATPVPPGAPAAFEGDVAIEDESIVTLAGAAAGADTLRVTLLPTGEEHVVPAGTTYVSFLPPLPDTTLAVRVAGENAAGAGPATVAATGRYLRPRPGTPWVHDPVAGHGTASFCFNGVWGGGHPVLAYVVKATAPGHTVTTEVPGTALAATVAGLRDDEAYDITVVARTAPYEPLDDPYAWDDSTVSVATPAPPPAVWATAVPGNGNAVVTPDVTSAVEVVASPGGATLYSRAGAPVTFGGLTRGTPYTFTVRAIGHRGYGPPATTEPVVPYGVPGAPGDVSAAEDPADPASVVVSWSPADPNGSGVVEYEVSAGLVTEPVPGDATSARLPNDPAATSATVRARNEAGWGAASTVPLVRPAPTDDPSETPTPTDDPTETPTPTDDPTETPPDLTPPGVPALAVSPVTLTGSALATYGVADAASYDVRYRVARYDTLFGAYRHPAAWQATTATAVATPTRHGWTYCFSVRARDAAGNVSAWSADDCTTDPLDDRSLTAGAGWSRGTGAAYLDRTYTASVTSGARLTLDGVRARRLALVVTRCARCGDVGVHVNGVLMAVVSTTSPATAYRQVVEVDLVRPRSGRVTLTRLSGRVYVDGLGAARR